MHRIDSATARKNANGDGKTGFSDNADLPNQDATYFTPEWSNALQEEVANVIEGLELTLDKSDNGQLLKALVQKFGEKKVLEDAVKDYKEMIKADRERLDKLEARKYEDTQIGETFWTSEHFLTSEEVTKYKGYGKWKRALQGRVAVGFSDDPEDHINFRTHGKEYGEHEHILTIEETAEHDHGNGVAGDSAPTTSDNAAYFRGHKPASYHKSIVGDDTDADKEGLTESVGGNKPHNNMQPSKTLDCWERIE